MLSPLIVNHISRGSLQYRSDPGPRVRNKLVKLRLRVLNQDEKWVLINRSQKSVLDKFLVYELRRDCPLHKSIGLRRQNLHGNQNDKSRGHLAAGSSNTRDHFRAHMRHFMESATSDYILRCMVTSFVTILGLD